MRLLQSTFIIAAVFIVALSTSAQTSATGRCFTIGFVNEQIPVTLPAQALSFTIPAPNVIVENVVVPPNATSGEYRPCTPASPRYVVTCNAIGGGTQVVVNFTDVIGANQWVAITLRMPGPILPVGAQWTTDQGGMPPARFELLEDVLVNETSAGSDDWVEIVNADLSAPIDIAFWQLEFRSRASSNNVQRFIFDPSILPTTVIPPGCVFVVHDGLASVPGGAIGFDVTMLSGAFIGNGSSNINWSCSNERSVYLSRPSNVANLAPIDGLVEGYYREADATVLSPFYPAPDTLQSFCENASGSADQHHSSYRMVSCLRFDPDAWGNAALPDIVMGTGTTGGPASTQTIGFPNPGQCELGGPPTVTLSLSRCPVFLRVEGVTMGSPVFLFVSDVVGPTQSSGTLAGLHLSPLLLGLLGATPGTASLPGSCTTGAFEIPIGFLPPLCWEFSAVALADSVGGPYPVVSNVVRFH